MNKKIDIKTVGTLLLIVIVVLVVVVVIMNMLNGESTGDITVSGGDSMVGLECIDAELTHPALREVQLESHTNTITANFVDDKLSSIMYRYVGTYQSEEEANRARVLAEADYNLILTNEYDVKIDVFSHNFMTNGNEMILAITGDADKVTSRTAPYFLLDALTEFPKTLDELRAAYETKGFSCVVENRN